MNELERILNLAGVSYEAPKKLVEKTQSPAQKKAFADMLAKKKGKASATSDHEEEHVKKKGKASATSDHEEEHVKEQQVVEGPGSKYKGQTGWERGENKAEKMYGMGRNNPNDLGDDEYEKYNAAQVASDDRQMDAERTRNYYKQKNYRTSGSNPAGEFSETDEMAILKRNAGIAEGPKERSDAAWMAQQDADAEAEVARDGMGANNPNFSKSRNDAEAHSMAMDDREIEQYYQMNRRRKKDLASPNPASEFAEDDLDEAPNEGNEFSGNRKAAIDAGEDEFEVDGKKYKVEAEEPDYSKDNLELCDHCDMPKDECECDHTNESLEVVEESPTMDTTQLITLLKNSGISEDQIASRLKVIEEEFGNTPEGVGETEPTVHGSDDNYNFAQAVNLSLKRYLDAADMKVQVSEHTKENLTAKYLASKK